jgi:periplasmic divalent cation tolerance protein
VNDLIQVVTTVDAKDKAQELAQHLVKLRLAACVQIDGPLESVYRWKGEIDSSAEWRLTIKTRRGVYNEVEDAIGGWHDYELPEILAMPVVAGNEKYVEWLNEQVVDNPLR